MAIPSTTERVALHTAPEWNEEIEKRTQNNILYYTTHPEKIDARLRELDREWDIERVLETQAAVATMVGLTLGIFSTRRWLVFPALIAGFLFQHAVQGWYPLLPVLRRLGVRTQSEIERERYALKAMRGDFKQITGGDRGEENILHVLRAVK